MHLTLSVGSVSGRVKMVDVGELLSHLEPLEPAPHPAIEESSFSMKRARRQIITINPMVFILATDRFFINHSIVSTKDKYSVTLDRLQEAETHVRFWGNNGELFFIVDFWQH